MIIKIFENLLYKIGTIASFAGIFLFLVGFGFNNTNILIESMVVIFLILIFILIFIMLMDILILCPIFYIKKRKKIELTNKEKYSIKYKEKINIVLNLYCVITYTIIFIIFLIDSNLGFIDAFYGIILGLIIIRKHKKNIMKIEEKTYIGKIDIIKVLTDLCVVSNLFILIIKFSDKINFFNEKRDFIISIFFVIIILITIALNLIKNKKEENEEKFKKSIIILKILLLMFFCIEYPQSMPCILIIFELLKELSQYIKTKVGKKIFILFSILAMIYPLMPILYILILIISAIFDI